MSRILGYVSSWLDAIPETEQDWIQKLEELKSTERRAGWEFARWLQWGVRQYSRTVDDIAYQVGYSPHTLQNILSAMNNSAALLAQELGLNLSHAVEVLGLDAEEKKALLTEAAENAWSPSMLRYMVRQQRMTNLVSTALNAQNGPVFNDNLTNDQTHHDATESVTAPVLLSQAIPELAEGDDVPFSHTPIHMDIAPPVKAFEIAEYIIATWGKSMAREVGEELARWW